MTDNQAKSQGEKKRSLGKIFGVVAILTVLSKVMGLVRDMVVNSTFGLAAIDPWFYAQLLTLNVLVLFGGLGGPFHSATVAILTPRKSDPTAGHLMAQIFAITILILSVITAIVYVFAPQLIHVIAPAADVTRTTMHVRIMSPLIVLAGIVGLSYGILNVYDKVFWPSFSPAIASIAIIVAALFFKDDLGLCLAVGSLLGAIGQALAQLPGVLTSPLSWRLRLTAEDGLRQYATMLWPATISTSIGQLNTWIDSWFIPKIGKNKENGTQTEPQSEPSQSQSQPSPVESSTAPSESHAVSAAANERNGAWSAIGNANRLIQLPLGVLITAMIVPILPRFTEQVVEGRIDDLKSELRRALRFLWFLSLPMAALFIAIPRPIVQLLFERGKFTESDTSMIVAALLFLAPSIFFYVARDLITRVFYAHQDSKTPYYVAMVAIVIHLILNYFLVSPLGISGIALAYTLMTIFNLSCLSFFARKKIGNLGFTKLIKPVVVMLLASAACGCVAYWLQSQTQEFLHTSLNLTQTVQAMLHLSPAYGKALELLFSIGVSSLAGMAIYLVICVVLKLEEPTTLVNRILKRKSKKNESAA